ncbi:hypothetical protein K1719_016605 [Acacia pycnantha]|nr:hypothetical protein K1719_016605 [Acacia pycnantha]
MNTQSLACFLVLIFTTSFSIVVPSNAKQTPPTADIFKIHHVWRQVQQWGNKTRINRKCHVRFAQKKFKFGGKSWMDYEIALSLEPCMLLGVGVGVICNTAFPECGIGGGALFIPILTIEAKQDLKTASSLSSFMITGGSIANVMFNLRRTNSKFRGKSLIDYDIALSFRTMHASWCECWSYLQHGVPKMIETSMAEIRGFVSGLAFFLRYLFSSRQ